MIYISESNSLASSTITEMNFNNDNITTNGKFIFELEDDDRYYYYGYNGSNIGLKNRSLVFTKGNLSEYPDNSGKEIKKTNDNSNRKQLKIPITDKKDYKLSYILGPPLDQIYFNIGYFFVYIPDEYKNSKYFIVLNGEIRKCEDLGLNNIEKAILEFNEFEKFGDIAKKTGVGNLHTKLYKYYLEKINGNTTQSRVVLGDTFIQDFKLTEISSVETDTQKTTIDIAGNIFYRTGSGFRTLHPPMEKHLN